MSSIGELATFYPVSGSFSSYATRFIDPSIGFTMGWLYYILWSLVSSVDVMVASNVLFYWDVFKIFSPLVWSLIFITIIFLLNIFTVKAFGETEFWLSLIKVITIIVFIVVGILMILVFLVDIHMDSRIIPKVKHLCRSFIWFLSSITCSRIFCGWYGSCSCHCR